MSNYPPGMTTTDLIHVGEITDDYDSYRESYDITDEELEDFICDRSDEIISFINRHKAITLTDLENLWKDANEATIEEAYEEKDQPDPDEEYERMREDA